MKNHEPIKVFKLQYGSLRQQSLSDKRPNNKPEIKEKQFSF